MTYYQIYQFNILTFMKEEGWQTEIENDVECSFGVRCRLIEDQCHSYVVVSKDVTFDD
jgi:hypothetical protein